MEDNLLPSVSGNAIELTAETAIAGIVLWLSLHRRAGLLFSLRVPRFARRCGEDLRGCPAAKAEDPLPHGSVLSDIFYLQVSTMVVSPWHRLPEKKLYAWGI